MKTAMVFASRKSEKAIASYSIFLTDKMKENKIDVDNLTYTAGSPKSFFKLFSKFKKYDVIHIQHEYNLIGWYGVPFFLVFFLLGLMKKQKIITTMHTVVSLKDEFDGKILKNFLRKSLYILQNKFIKWASDSIVVHAHFFVPILTQEYGFSKKKISVFRQGIIENIKLIPKSKAKKELKLSGPVYLIIGNLTPESGLDIIVKQANKIGKTVLVVSSPIPVNDRKKGRLAKYLNSTVKYAKKNKFEKYVRFDIKHISDEIPLWWKYFSAADIVLQAYRGKVASAIFTHAMSANTPVVGSDIPFFNEISKEYGCIKVVKQKNNYSKILKEALQSKNYKKMEKECKRYSKENSWNNISLRYKGLYKFLLKNKS
jgi:glycosyltransferase involved in cell wall biosynthesis